MLGGGNFLFMNKVLPGAYINFESKSRASVEMAERGYVAVALALPYGKTGEIVKIERSDLEKRSLELLGYEYGADEIRPIREILENAKTLYLYRLNNGGVKASNDYAIAKYEGTRGNLLSISILNVPGESGWFLVQTKFDGTVVDTQKIQVASQLVANDYVDFKTFESITAQNNVALTNGADGSAIQTQQYQEFLNKIENYYINTLIVATTDTTINKLVANFTKRMRDEVGSKFQAVLYRHEADYEGVVNVDTKVLNDTNEASLCYWVGGALAGCDINKSITNKKYTGEYTLELNYTQTDLINKKLTGKFVLHKVNEDTRILSDINSFVSWSKQKNKDFTKNQTIRVLDQVAVDISNLFNKRYLGVIPNDEIGRASLWKDIVVHHENLQAIRAIEGFKDTDITIEKGQEKDQVVITDTIVPVNAMEQLYMSVIIG